MAYGKSSFDGQIFEATVNLVGGVWVAQVSEPDTTNDPIRFGPQTVESEDAGKKVCENFLFELFQQRLWR